MHPEVTEIEMNFLNQLEALVPAQVECRQRLMSPFSVTQASTTEPFLMPCELSLVLVMFSLDSTQRTACLPYRKLQRKTDWVLCGVEQHESVYLVLGATTEKTLFCRIWMKTPCMVLVLRSTCQGMREKPVRNCAQTRSLEARPMTI